MTSKSQLGASSQAHPIDGRHHWNRKLLDSPEHVVAEASGADGVFPLFEPANLLEVGSGDEHALLTRANDHSLEVGPSLKLFQCPGQPGHHARRKAC